MNEIKSYKFKRLNWNFWRLYKYPPLQTSYTKLLYSFVTHLVMQRWKDDEIKRLVGAWNKKHGFRMNWAQVGHVLGAVKEYTLETRRQSKREEMRRYRARKKLQSKMDAQSNATTN